MTATEPASRLVYMGAVLNVLREHGGLAEVGTVYRSLEDQGIARRSDLTAIQRDGGTRFAKEVRFARQELAAAGLLRSVDGKWSLTPEGATTHLTVDEARNLVSERRRALRG